MVDATGADEEWAVQLLRPRDDHGKRRLAVLEAAYDVVARAGFEGLRTRAVADLVGINIATLHYYFPTKQALVEGLSALIGAKFVTTHGPSPQPSGMEALDRLRQEFADGRFYREHRQDLLMVIQEFTLRGQRDPEVQKIVVQMNMHWRAGVEAAVRTGIADGTFRADIPFEDVLEFLMAILTGIALAAPEQTGAIQRQTESWILSDKAKRRLREDSGGKRNVGRKR